MDNDTHERTLRTAGRIAVAALFLLILALCTTRATDTDLWWHLAAGDRIRSTGEIPHAEPFSFTAIGHRWIDAHWLFQVVLSWLYGLGGVRLLDFLKGAFILGLFALLFRRCRRSAGEMTVVAILLLVTMACQERFLTRPEIVSWGFMLIVLAVLEQALDAPGRPARARLLFLAIPCVLVIWVNVQTLFILAPAFLALALLATAPTIRSDPDRPIDFLIALALAALVSLVNPYGAGLLRLPFEQFFVQLGGRSLLSRTIAEFQPPLSGYLVTPSIVAFVLLAAAVLLAIVADFPRVRAFDLLVTIATLLVALRARRNIPIFALAAAPVLARHAGAILAPVASRVRPIGARAAALLPAAGLAAFALWMTVDVASNRFFLRRPTERWFGSGVIPYYFPEESAAYVAAGGVPGNVFHSLAVGGYLIHAWQGERGVFIDGRNDPYIDDVLPAYLKAIADPASFEEVVRRYQITAVLWPHQRALEGKELLAYLARGRGWVLAHLDPAAAVYLRADILSPARIADSPFPQGLDRQEVYAALQRQIDAKPFDGPPIREIALGEFFSVSGDAPGAEFFYRRALTRLPRQAPVLYGLALSLDRQGRSAEACAIYSQAVEADPGYLPAVASVGACLVDAGKMKEAERSLETAYAGGERSARLLEARARVFEERGDLKQASEAYREALVRSPRDGALLRSLALYQLRHGEPASALPYYTTASQVDPDDPVIAREMAALLSRLGRTSAALDVARDAGRRAMERLSGGGSGVWAASSASREEDRRLLLLAADLESKVGEKTRAGEYLDALKKAGLAVN